jgi:two-component system, cell cycle sensor histidine kinase and response regulator CckA
LPSEQQLGTVDLLLTDVVMPGMNGRVLADRVAAIQPDSAVIFMSGYTDGIIAHHGVLEPGVAFIQKPATPVTIATRMRKLLATRANGGPGKVR